MSLRACLAPLLFAGAIAGARVNAQQVIVRSVGPGPIGPRLIAALAGPHDLIRPAPTAALLPRDSAYPRTVIILRRDAVIEGRVRGDVIVVGGNAFMHPGAIVDGRVVAIGGGVYQSMLAIARDGTESYRDFTFDAESSGATYALVYRPLRLRPSPPVSFPGVYGIRIPSYDRSDGLSLPFGPTISLDTGRYELTPTVTYRSNLGAFDPALDGDLTLGRRARAHIFVGRTTLTNDDWIWSDLVNSAATIFRGLDTRNYYRANRGEVTVYRLFESAYTVFEPFLGARAERDQSVGPDSFATGGPWSIFDRTSVDGMLRPNPPIVPGDLSSALLGARFGWENQRVRATFVLSNEGSAFNVGSLRFVQSTLSGEIRFPTFGTQQFSWSTHVVYTFGDTAPPQRWSYLGGSGTLITLPLLSLGGDRLVYFESDYEVPIERVALPLLGAPMLTLRHIIGSAGVATLPALDQNLALRVSLSFLRVDVAVDPARRSWKFGYGLSAAR
ncbi:MAG TPA: hypothetical protein VJO33_20735 [Gemmatimonadaceae bacterium]|nr:hypothetical protein [Gemmatimonadaceae bacterium]